MSTASNDEEGDVQLPIPLSKITGKYLIFSIEALFYLRRHHGVVGTLIGTLHQNPSQNVFLGLPAQIMPEEAEYLVDRGVCYVVDDAQAHDKAMSITNKQKRKQELIKLREEASAIQENKVKDKQNLQRKALKKLAGKTQKKTKSQVDPVQGKDEAKTAVGDNDEDDDNESVFSQATSAVTTRSVPPRRADVKLSTSMTPATSQPIFPDPDPDNLESTNSSVTDPFPYPATPATVLLSYLHKITTPRYHLTPGLRFGAHFSVYPGDPLRYHSHFLATGYGWDEEIDLMDLVGGGRLGTGVKKGWLIGGEEPADPRSLDTREGEESKKCRVWSIEWAGM